MTSVIPAAKIAPVEESRWTMTAARMAGRPGCPSARRSRLELARRQIPGKPHVLRSSPSVIGGRSQCASAVAIPGIAGLPVAAYCCGRKPHRLQGSAHSSRTPTSRPGRSSRTDRAATRGPTFAYDLNDDKAPTPFPPCGGSSRALACKKCVSAGHRPEVCPEGDLNPHAR